MVEQKEHKSFTVFLYCPDKTSKKYSEIFVLLQNPTCDSRVGHVTFNTTCDPRVGQEL